MPRGGGTDGVDTVHRDDLRLTVELRSVTAGARRRAVRDGDDRVDTAHLLHSLLESDPRVREAVDGGAGGGTDGGAGGGQVARVLGYLVQRSIGYGMRWRGAVEDSGALALAPSALASLTSLSSLGAPGWSPAAATAIGAAVARAQERGTAQADGGDLLEALLADPACRAVEVLRAAGVDPARLLVRPPALRGTDDSRYWGDGPVAS
ncbi:Clp protease N-terminal domain-containing protein [Streptomyces sp. NPDC058691]|uniref:Clp protease N-terminal domain-containing protein n=1 Tax=Streptomyces sp. NPDC058691 TaxID=3346601 RepID=UPI00365D6A81